LKSAYCGQQVINNTDNVFGGNHFSDAFHSGGVD